MTASISAALRSEIDRFAMQAQALIEDGSSVQEKDLQVFVETRGEVLTLTQSWGEAFNRASGFALEIAVRLSRLRKLIYRKDGHLDLAGNTHVYSRLVESDIRKVLDDLKDPNTGQGIPLDVFRSRVKQARSDNKVNFAIAAELAVESDPVLAATEVQVNVAVVDDEGAPVEKDGVPVTETVTKTVAQIVAENPAGTTSPVEVPEPLAAKVAEIFETQVSKDGKPLAGFAASDIPPTFGRQPKAKRERKPKAETTGTIVGTTGEQDDSSNIVPPDRMMFLRWVRNTKATEVLPFLHRVLTEASDVYVGAPGTAAVQPNPVLPGGDREQVANLLHSIGSLSIGTGGTILGRQGFGKTALADHRWKDDTGERLAAMIGQSNVPAEPEPTESAPTEPEPEPKTVEQVVQDLLTPDAEPVQVPEPVVEAVQAARKSRRRGKAQA